MTIEWIALAVAVLALVVALRNKVELADLWDALQSASRLSHETVLRLEHDIERASYGRDDWRTTSPPFEGDFGPDGRHGCGCRAYDAHGCEHLRARAMDVPCYGGSCPCDCHGERAA